MLIPLQAVGKADELGHLTRARPRKPSLQGEPQHLELADHRTNLYELSEKLVLLGAQRLSFFAMFA